MTIKLRKFQEGGAMPPQEEEAPMQETGAPAEQDPIAMLAEMSMQALETQDCQAALQVCEAFVQLVQQAQNGGTPEEAPQGEPVYRRGGVLVKRI